MCFYVKRHLDYKPYMTPSYKVTREAEAVKEKEREKKEKKEKKKEVRPCCRANPPGWSYICPSRFRRNMGKVVPHSGANME